MTDQPNKSIYSDIVSTIALIGALASFGLALWVASEQTRQWKATSLGRVIVSKQQFVVMKSLNAAELSKSGVDQSALVNQVEDSKVSDKVSILWDLMARDIKSQKLVRDNEGRELRGFSVKSITNRLLGLKVKLADVEILRSYRYVIYYKKVGLTSARQFQVAITLTENNGQTLIPLYYDEKFPATRQSIDLYAESDIGFEVRFLKPLNEPFPVMFTVHSHIQYQDPDDNIQSYDLADDQYSN